LKRGGYGGATCGVAPEVAGGLSGEACDDFVVLKNGLSMVILIFEEGDDREAHHAIREIAESFEGFTGRAAGTLDKHHSVVSDLKGRSAGGMESVADKEGGDGETDIGVCNHFVHERLGIDDIFHEDSAAEGIDPPAKFAELKIAATDEAAKLGAAEAIALDGVIDGAMG
jgi:hypothetical protein